MSQHVDRTTPYPWPFDGDLAGSATALLVVVPEGSALPPTGGVEVRIGRLAGAVHAAGGAVVLATTAPPANPGRSARPTVLGQDTSDAPGPALHAWAAQRRVAGQTPDLVVGALGLDAFFGSGLDAALRSRGIVRLLLAGFGLETTVHSTMRDANDRGYECLLVVDACAAADPALVPAAVSMIEMSGGIFGAVGLTADVIAALAAPAPTPTPAASTAAPASARAPEGAPR
jgi:biuret amidohydrolase